MSDKGVMERLEGIVPNADGVHHLRGYNSLIPTERYDAVLDRGGLTVLRFYAPAGEAEAVRLSTPPQSVVWERNPPGEE